MIFLIRTCLTIALIALGATVLEPGLNALKLLTSSRDASAVAEHALLSRTPADYADAITAAASARDEDLAASLVALADARGVALPPAARADAEQALADARARMGPDAWTGFLTGAAPNEQALAGAIAADLTGFGDIRDLGVQAGNYLAGQEVDPLLTGLSAAGLGVTAATLASAGMALPARSGLSMVKVAKRAGKLSPALARDVAAMAIRTAEKQGAKAAALELGTLGSDVAVIGSKAGYRAALATLGTARSAREVGVMARLSERFGKATRGVLVLSGGVLTFASVAGTAAFWAATLIIWLIAAGMAVTRFSWALGRRMFGRRRPQPAAAALVRWVASQAIMTRARTTMGKTA